MTPDVSTGHARHMNGHPSNGTADQARAATGSGLSFDRVFSSPDRSPFSETPWRTTTAEIKDDAGNVIFSQTVEVPAGWSDQAARVVASKFFYGDIAKQGGPRKGGREHSVNQLIHRVARTITDWGHEDGYFASGDDAVRFYGELSWLLLHQHGSFNSPVWFNVGLSQQYGVVGAANGWRWEKGREGTAGDAGVRRCEDAYVNPQCSACFIVKADDDMASILERAKTEGMLFKYGSGVGADNSTIRSTKEKLSSGGRPSGPVSFMRIYDAVAGQIKSGGAVRRAAKMETLKDWHPDVLEFAGIKAHEDRKAKALVAAGYSGGMNGEAAATVGFQNANLSVRCSDAFLRAVETGGDWTTRAVTTGRDVETFPASRLMDAIAEGTWVCGDPGVQYEDAIQKWHTCPNTAPINSSNPCCLTGDTLVRTSEGKLPIAMLARMDSLGVPLPMAFSFDFEAGLPVLRRIEHAWKAGSTRRLTEVRTDKGLVFRSTPDHRYYLRDGRAVEAQDLKAGDRLRKIGRSHIGSRNPRASILTKDGSPYQSRWMWEQANGPIPEGYEVHHKNEDRWDDRLSNFELKPRSEHRSDHSVGLANANTVECPEALLVETWEAIEAEKGYASVWRWNAYIKEKGLKGVVPLARGDGRIRGMSWAEFSAWIESNRQLVNDCVESVRMIELAEPVDVYDIEVDGVHNFGVTTLHAKHDIVISNSEYMHIDNSACNLICTNLMKFRREDGSFDVARYRAACRVFLVAQEIVVDRSSYPTARIAENAHKFRQLGQGYTGLGAIVMSLGLPYDSDEGRSLAGAITAVMHAETNLTSIDLAREFGPFEGYAVNREPMLNVMRMHLKKAEDGLAESVLHEESDQLQSLWAEAVRMWYEVVSSGEIHGFRNSQTTVLMPCGTTGFMLDSGHATGMEPSIGLVQYKTLAGGGMLKIVNPVVPLALGKLGYDEPTVRGILDYIDRNDKIEGAPGLDGSHLSVFDCAFPAPGSDRAIHWQGHLKMMGAIQPFLSGAISKTCNVPKDATVADIRDAYLEGWRLGLKAVAIFRDGSKESQPVTTSKATPRPSDPIPVNADGASDMESFRTTVGWTDGEIMADRGTFGQLVRLLGFQVGLGPDGRGEGAVDVLKRLIMERDTPRRERLPDTRRSLTHKLSVDGVEAYMTVGEYPDGRPGELFVEIAKEGSTLGGMMDAWATSVSMSLQYGIPLDVIVAKFSGGRFEPAGTTGNPKEIPIASSLIDYVVRWMGMHYIDGYRAENAPKALGVEAETEAAPVAPLPRAKAEPARPRAAAHGPLCGVCGGMTIPAGRCWTCTQCATSVGGCG
jgi:ribonucleotide reductase alpha subunit